MLARRPSFVLAAALLLLAPVAAPAQVWIVDDDGGPGVDFLDIQDAHDSPLVADGDVLLVRPGVYGEMILTRGLTVLGDSDDPLEVSIGNGSSAIDLIDVGGPMVFAGVDMFGLAVIDCPDGVYVSDASIGRLDAVNSADCRVEHLISGGAAPIPQVQVRVSSLELEGGPTRGIRSTSGFGDPAGTSHLRVARCDAFGPVGADNPPFSCQAQPGEAGITVFAPTSLQVLGDGSQVVGGDGGLGCDCAFDALGGPGMLLSNPSATARVSGATFQGGIGLICTPVQAPAIEVVAGNLVEPAVADPTLRRLGVARTGGVVRFVVRAPGAASVRLAIGTAPLALDLPGVVGRLSTTSDVLFTTLPLDGSGTATLLLNVPSSLELGQVFHAQAGAFYASGEPARLTNPSLLVVR